jgi:hypothetical protein
MNDLENILNENQAPAARASLSARILAAAETAEPANDVQPSRPWWAMGGMAAMAVMAAFFILQPSTSADVEWDQIADVSGFSDLYDWVEGSDEELSESEDG